MLVVWWIAFAYATVAGGVSRAVIGTSSILPGSDRVATVQSAYGWSVTANVIAAVSALLAAVFVAALGRRLQNVASH